MGCLNITPLVLSDTFNTWFERTNELITGINSFYIRGLSASNRSGTDIEAFVIQEDQDCFYTIDLKTGPFLGFITSGEGGYDSAIHGTGDYVNPYNLVLKFDGSEPTIDKDLVATGDYLLVSDTDDNSLVKKTTADAFLTRLLGGSKISVSQNSNGEWTINFVPLFFSPFFEDNVFNTSAIPLREIGFTHNASSGWTGSFSFGPISTSNPEEVLPYSITVSPRTNDASHMTFTSYSVTGPGDIYYPHGTLPEIPSTKTWFSTSRTSLRIESSITSDSQSGADPFYPFTVENNSNLNINYRFGWRFGGFSTTNELSLSGVQNYLNTSNLNMKRADTNTNGSDGYIINTPDTEREFEFQPEGRLYFIVTADDSYSAPANPFNFSETYSYKPLFRDPLGGAIMEEGWEELGSVTGEFGDGVVKNYIVYRSVLSYGQNRRIIIGGQ